MAHPKASHPLVGHLLWDLVWWRGDPGAPRCPLSRHQKAPLRPLTADERKELTRLSRSLSAPAAEVERARALLAIADGATYTAQPTRWDDGTPRPSRPGLAASTATGSRP